MITPRQEKKLVLALALVSAGLCFAPGGAEGVGVAAVDARASRVLDGFNPTRPHASFERRCRERDGRYRSLPGSEAGECTLGSKRFVLRGRARAPYIVLRDTSHPGPAAARDAAREAMGDPDAVPDPRDGSLVWTGRRYRVEHYCGSVCTLTVMDIRAPGGRRPR